MKVPAICSRGMRAKTDRPMRINEYDREDQGAAEGVLGKEAVRLLAGFRLGRLLLRGCGQTMEAHQIDVQEGAACQQGRQKQRVDRVEPGQGQARHGLPAQHDSGDEIADHRKVPGNVGADHGGPIGLHVPGQEVAGETQPQGDQEQADAHDPGQLPGSLVAPGKVGAQQIRNTARTRAPAPQ